ncbi:MAG: DUF1553 domain-containing protein [Planctomycetaceae bacterium]|nr:DUF1553 domain-containing protein [Planctomycetaceae bacterium]MBN8603194.1 DUF1553 domain-containing protein [Planctomycetota bacterium]
MAPVLSKRVAAKLCCNAATPTNSHLKTDWLMMVSYSQPRAWHAFIALIGLLCVPVSALVAQEMSREDFFESQVRPLLLNKCAECHGSETQWGELRVDSLSALLKGGEHGPAIVVGQPAKSLLITAIERSGDLKMPPEDKTPLTATEIQTLKKWIEEGAFWTVNDAAASAEQAKQQKWKSHWAFQPIQHTAPPSIESSEALTPLDNFIVAKLTQHGLRLAPTADRRTLIRRLYFDLIGMPPTPQQVAEFEADSDPSAYSKIVDRLLDSQAYGEHWSRLWLDVARYSDTKGYVYGREEKNFIHAYVYRDWVSRAFKEDLPYDRFLQLQLAADQLLPPNHPDRAAMGFLTLGRRFLGVSHDIIDDRIDTVSRGLMGITASCARCHDHKYDPVPTADYYSLYGVFLNSSEQVERINSSPEYEVGLTKSSAAWEEELAKRQNALSQKLAQAREEASQRMRSRIKDYFVAQSELEKYPQEGFDQILATTDLIPNLVRRLEMLLTSTQLQSDRRFAAWHRFSAIPKNEFAAQAQKVTEELQTLRDSELHPKVKAIFATAPSSFREVTERYGQLFAEIESAWSASQKQGESSSDPIPTTLPNGDDEELRQFLYSEHSPCFIPDEHISSTEGLFDSNTCTELWRLQGEVDRWILQAGNTVPFSTILVDRKTDYPARVLKRGNPAQKGDTVRRHQLSLIDPKQHEYSQGSGRLALAQSITSHSNPLTARVWINRVWKQHFGTGLVRTPSDFGLRAEPPSHPELLDWLAEQFMNHGWSTKKLHRWIVMSRTYQQASLPNLPADYLHHANQVDPDNRLLWRYTPRRLSFEMMRDSWLSISGELDLTFGGRAGELFAGPNQPQRRTLYASIDRQFVPGVLRMFDYANPDMHAPQRSETTVPQQALFSLNHPFIAARAQALIRRLNASEKVADDPTARTQWLFQTVLQRPATQEEIDALLQFVNAPEDSAQVTSNTAKAWNYGYGEFEPEGNTQLKSFTPLPFFAVNSWQGSTSFPDAALGWVRLTADGGHPGNDLQHAAVRRWTSPFQGTIHLKSLMQHEEAVGDGVRCTILSSRHGLIGSEIVHNKKWDLERDGISVEPGDTLDFITDIYQVLNTDQYLWEIEISPKSDSDFMKWNSRQDFHGPASSRLNRWEEAAQILLISNELLFVE